MDEDQAGEDEERGAASFEARLAAARERQGLDRPAASSQGTDLPPNALALGLRVGVELASALAVAVAIGYWLDRWLHTRPLFLAVFVPLGGAAGVMNVWRLVGPRGRR
ncbi:MAG: AtpZ/AtpI family protein [Acidibrevibacterium sp.]|uniref:AtpZ/AtpI family protein n=1 Tax=Acidibrevibacterium sp. TaxID=2606776 RepID=UPI003D0790C8